MKVFSEVFVGSDDGPPSASAYKRAVYKQPPRHFMVETLEPRKQGNAYSYGMRITPVRSSKLDRHTSLSGVSTTSSGSSGSGSHSIVDSFTDTVTTLPHTTEYEIWRRWEDCLYFQDLLESRYAMMSREKRARLQAGKGVKKNGVYPHEDPLHRQRAASFESLPPGPDPTMIAKDVHEFLPRLTKKGTLFKASKETISQRAVEFRALIENLLKEGEDVPTLIKELRQLRIIRDFFGFWRRDHDLMEKERSKRGDVDSKASTRSRANSFTSTQTGTASTRHSSVFSGGAFGMYFSASNLSLQLPSPLSIPPDSPSEKPPRRPLFMQERKTPMTPVSPAMTVPIPHSTNKSIATLHVPRQRAQTMQGLGMTSYNEASSSSGHSATTASTNSSSSQSATSQAIVMKPPASAPAGVSFTFTTYFDGEEGVTGRREEDGGYISDSASVAESSVSSHMYQSPVAPPRPPRTPRSAPPFITSNARGGSVPSLATVIGNDKGKGKEMDVGEPIIVSLEEGESLLDFPIDEGDVPYEDDERMIVMREHEHLIPRSLDPLPVNSELPLVGKRLQDFTIEEEEDEHDDTSTVNDGDSSHQHNIDEDVLIHENKDNEPVLFEEEPIPLANVPTPRRIGSPPVSSENRNAMFFSPNIIFGLEEDSMRPTTPLERLQSPKIQTPAGSRPHTPMSSTRSAAHANALNSLTANHVNRTASPSPVATKLINSSTASMHSSIRTSGSSGVTSLETPNSIGVVNHGGFRPISSSTIGSSVELDNRLTSSPIILHAPLYEEPEDLIIDEDRDQHKETGHYSRGSVASMRSFMTDSSADAIIPRRSISPSPAVQSVGSQPPNGNGNGVRRSLSSGSRRMNRMSQISNTSSILEGALSEGSEELIDTYFYGSSPPEDVPGTFHYLGRQQSRGTLSQPDNFPKPFQNRPPGQYHLPWSPPAQHYDPPHTASSANSLFSIDSASISSPSPSVANSLFDDATALSIKGVFGDHIIAFRADRGISFEEVRTKLHHKFVNQQGAKLSPSFTLTYKPSFTAGLMGNSTSPRPGRARSSSVSSAGAPDTSALRIISSQKDWQDAIASCGTKLTLHVISA